MLKREIIEDIAMLLRGFFATPVISSLGRLGVLERMASVQDFTLNYFTEIPNKNLLYASIQYLLRLGLLEKREGSDEIFSTSELGKEIFKRANSFYVPHSYFDYMSHYHDLIQTQPGAIKCEVERLENVIGSGKTHLRYFPPVISYIKRKLNIDLLVDIGCGDGQFLSAFIKSIPDKKIVGIDLAQLAVESTIKNIKQIFPKQDIATLCCDAVDVNKWGKEVLSIAGKANVIISMWFLLHEISRAKPGNLINFFGAIHKIFPSAPIVVGEVVCQGDDVLVKNHESSLMPEYLFFHEMSGQGILLWHEYLHILQNIPYELAFERLFDEAQDNNGRKIPSTFVWCLTPIV
jgi:SAM-dependent methyltransferase